MYLHNFSALICILYGGAFIGQTIAYPMLQIPRLFGSADEEARYKKSDITLPKIDADVLELEHLKDENLNASIAHSGILNGEKLPEQQQSAVDVKIPTIVIAGKAGTAEASGTIKDIINKADSLPQLEHQLEIAVQAVSTTTITPITTTTATLESESLPAEKENKQAEHGMHRPPILPTHDGGKMGSNGNQHQQQHTEEINVGAGGIGVALTKPFYGAARLAFGQNPEVLPTTSTSTTTSTIMPSIELNNHDVIIDVHSETNTAASTVISEGLQIPNTDTTSKLEPLQIDEKSNVETATVDNTKENIGEGSAAALDAVKAAGQRRSVTLISPKTPENILRHNRGQYSSFDMAQYVFWTGDEAGVARAVEEFIEQGLMTRENALKFLRDIRLGIEYLQKSYANRIFPDDLEKNNVKKSFFVTSPPPTVPSTTLHTIFATTEKPFPYVNLERDVETPKNVQLLKNLENISLLHKLQEMNNNERQELTDYDEATGRAKIAEFLYTEYTLEEILYKLAKVMFTQSLAHGSDEAQRELQKLTNFLEREGNLGLIPIDLQKKVLHVLLTALSDTLNEHPELLPAARSNLLNTYNKFPLHSYAAALN